MKLKLILTTAIVGAALALPSVSSAAPAAVASANGVAALSPRSASRRTAKPFPGFNSVNITLAGLPPFTEFVGNPGGAGG